MNNIDKNLCSKLLPVPMVIERFVEEDENCNYEKYLLEIVNASSYFKSLSGGKEYIAPIDEAHGENDADSGIYSIDFKLVESSSYLEAKRQFSASVDVLCPGVKAINKSRKQGRTIAISLHCALREINTFEQIENILNNKVNYVRMNDRTDENCEEQLKADLQTYFKILKKRKNLLLFIPEVFSFRNKSYELPDAIDMIKNALCVDYLLGFNYRKNKMVDKDTFLLCMYDEKFLIYKHEDGDLVFKDIVPYNKSSTFEELLNDYNTFYW